MLASCWAGIVFLATLSGAEYPNLVAAQWALESNWGRSPSGVHNYFGMKGKGSGKPTDEYINGKRVRTYATFIDYESIDASVVDVVNKWHKDYKWHKGVNNAATREDAARMLARQGYATSPDYADLLIRLMNRNSVPVPENLHDDTTRQSYRCR